MDGLKLVRIGRDHLPEIEAALSASGLPLDDLGNATAIYQLEDSGGPIGWAAFEARGEAALLRSVVIVESRRGTGAGEALVRGVVDRAAAEGIKELWLLTQTAAPFFGRLGFVTADRATAPASMRATSEFATICPASAECMTMRLRWQ